jgi:omega-6 fatty acid desaturase (delta-12 desaturase)
MGRVTPTKGLATMSATQRCEPSYGWREVKAVALRFQSPVPRTAILQAVTTIGLLVVLLAAMHGGIALGWWWTVPVLALPTAAFTVRTFMLQHDCGHASMFNARWANDGLGWLCSLFTLTPYAHWRRQHAGHHSVWNDLDCRDRGADIYSTCATVSEYRLMRPAQRLAYRTIRHPLIAQLLLPPLVFLLLYRLPFDAPRGWQRERRGVHLTNLALLGLYGGLALLLGWWPVTLVLLAVMVPASIIGVWLFSLQHRFDGVLWERHAKWHPAVASLKGSSYLRLPRVLQWLTASIGFHHIHHLAPRIPNHQLEACHRAHPAFASVARVVTLRDGLRASRYALWDEASQRMVTFAEATIRPPCVGRAA